MSIIRKIKCDMCGVEADEVVKNSGWMGWGIMQGVQLNGVETPCFCPKCLTDVMNFIDTKEK